MKIKEIQQLKRNKQRIALEHLSEALTLIKRIKRLDDIIFQMQLEKIVRKNNKYVRGRSN